MKSVFRVTSTILSNIVQQRSQSKCSIRTFSTDEKLKNEIGVRDLLDRLMNPDFKSKPLYRCNPSKFATMDIFPVVCAALNTKVIDISLPETQTWITQTIIPSFGASKAESLIKALKSYGLPPKDNVSLENITEKILQSRRGNDTGPIDPYTIFSQTEDMLPSLARIIESHVRVTKSMGMVARDTERKNSDTEKWRSHAVEETFRYIIESVPQRIFLPGSKDIIHRNELLVNYNQPEFAATWCETLENYQIVGRPDYTLEGQIALPLLSKLDMYDPISEDAITDWDEGRDEYFDRVTGPKEKTILFTILKRKRTLDQQEFKRIIKTIRSKKDPSRSLCNVVIEMKNLNTSRTLETKQTQSLWYMASTAISHAILEQNEKPVVVFSLPTDSCKYILMGWQLNNLDFESRQDPKAKRNLLYIWDLGDLYTSTSGYGDIKINSDVYKKLLQFIVQLYNLSIYGKCLENLK